MVALASKPQSIGRVLDSGFKLFVKSFAGVFPMSQPQYLVFVMIDEPKGTKASFGFATGGWTAAPAVGRIISRVAPLLGVRRSDTLAAANP